MPDGNKMTTITISSETILKVFLFGLLFFVLYLLRNFLLILLASIVAASFIDSVRRRLGKFGTHHVLAVVAIYLTILIILASIFYLIVPTLIEETSILLPQIAEFLPESDLVQKIQDNGLSELRNILNNDIQGISLGDLLTNTRDFITSVSSGFFKTLGTIFGGLVNFTLIVVLSFFIAIQKQGIKTFLEIVVPKKYENYVIDLWTRTQRKIALWVQGQFIVSLITGVVIYIGLSVIGLKYALLIALLAALFELVPYGMIFAAIPAVIVAYIDGGISMTLIVLAYYFVTQQLEAYFIIPFVMKKILGISPLVIVLSVLIGVQLAGILGALLAIPVATFFVELMNDIQKKKRLVAEKAT